MDYSRIMSTEDKIRHYQRSIERSEHDYKRLHHCIDVLGKLPVTVDHLQEIGIGRTVNSLRKIKSGVGDAARILVNKWKQMVAQQEPQSSDEEDEACVPDVPDSYESPEHDFEPESTTKEEEYEPQAMTKPFTPPMVIDTDMMNSIKQELDNDIESSEEEDIPSYENEKNKTSKHSSKRSSSKDNSEKSSSSKDKHKTSRDKNESSKVSKNSDRSEQKKKDKHRSKSDSSSSSSSKDKKNSDSNKRKVDSGSDCESDKKKRKKSVSEEEDDEDEKDENNFVINENDSSDENEKNLDNGEDEEEDSIDTKKSSSSHKSRDKESSLKSSSDKSKSKDKHRSSSHDKKENKHSSSKSDKDKKHSSKESSKSKSSSHSSSNSNSSSSSSKDRSKDKEKDKNSSKEKVKESSSKHKDEKDKSKKEVKDDMGKCKEKSHKEHKASSSSSKDSKERKENKESKEQKESKGKKKVKKPIDDSIDHMSGTSFADALGMCTMPPPSKKKKESVSSPSATKSSKSSEQPSTSSSTSRSSFSSQKVKNELPDSPEELPLLSSAVKLEPLKSLEEEVDLAATLPEPSLNYKPLPYVNPAQRRQEEDAMLQQVIYAKNQRTKVFSGNKCSSSTIPTLYELCIRILIENIDALEFTGGVPYYIIKPVLERASPDQLFMLEHYNPYLMEDSDALWQFHCNKDFRTKKREEMESWREMYMRCLDEREAKLKALTANIKLSIDKSAPVRSTKLAYVDDVIVKPPRNVIRQQAKFGTAKATTKSIDLKKKLITGAAAAAAAAGSSSGASTSSERISVPNPVRIRAPTAAMKKAKAPLMAKALQAIKGRYKR